MAGHGPPPKDPALRQRRNKTSTRAVVEPGSVAPPVVSRELPVRLCSFCPEAAAPSKAPKRAKHAKRRRKPKVEAPPDPPECPTCGGTRIVPWHRWTLAWWSAFWDPQLNPFLAQYLEHEIVGGIQETAFMRDAFNRDLDRGIVNVELERAIRLRERALGLDPLARRAAQWEIKRPPASRPSTAPAGATPDPGRTAVPDMRKVLFMEGAGGNRA
jgi:hypothetical protein